MSSDENNSGVIDSLSALEGAAGNRDASAIEAALAELRELSFNALYLDGAQALLEREDWSGLEAWAVARLEEAGPSANPFAGGFDFDLDDAFLDVEDSGIRESAPAEGVSGLLGPFSDGADVDVADVSLSDEAPKGRPHVLSGKFNLVSPEAAERAKKLSFAEQLDEVAAGKHDLPEESNSKQTRPNLDHDRITSHEVIVDDDEEVEPPKLKAAGGFDFGFGSEFEESEAAQSEPTAEEIQYDASPSKPDKTTKEQHRELTPLRQLPSQNPEGMFDDLVEALAAESSVSSVPRYKNEPRVHSAQTNPFGQNEPTGAAHRPMAAESHAAQSYVQTNMNAILLEARRLRSVGELGAALDIVKKVISRGANADAEELQRDIEQQLESKSIATIGALDLTPAVCIDMSKLSELDLDHRAGYMMSQVDGMLTFEDLLELSGMPRLETLEILAQLVEEGVISA